MKNDIYHLHLTLMAISFIVIGLILRYFIGRRRFNRRGVAGLQHFNNYKQALITTIWERAINIVAALLIIGGVILYVIQ